MKKSLLALAVLGAFAGAASAQSTVTLFGVVDLSLKHVKNGDEKAKQMGSDGIQSSRFGVRGVEDLGGGLSAGFHLESGIDAGTGANTGATFWQRRSTISLLGGFGEIRLGRDLNPMFLGHASYDPFGTVGVGTIFNIISGLGSGAATLVRTSNAISYLTPAGLPIYAQVMIAPGEGVPGNKFTGGRVGFASGPVDVSVAAARTETGTPEDFDQRSIGGSYDLGFMKLFAAYLKSDFGTREQKVLSLAATAPVGSGLFKVLYGRSSMGGGAADPAPLQDGSDASILALQYVHNLSKRTALYGSFSRISNDGDATHVVGALPPTAQTGFSSRGFELGVRHAF